MEFLSESDLAVLARLVRAQRDADVPVGEAREVLRVELHIGVDAAGRRFLTRAPAPATPEALAPPTAPASTAAPTPTPARAAALTAPPAPAAPPPPTWSPPLDRRRWRGCLLAGAVGDALGAPAESKPMDQIRALAGPRGITDMITTGDGLARITDDTQMTLFTLEALIRAHAQRRRDGTADVVHSLRTAYQRWLHTQGTPWARARGPHDTSDEPNGWLIGVRGLFKRRAPGATCFLTLQEYGATGRAGTIDRPVNDSKGCGGVMRAAPVALWSPDTAEVFEVAAASAAITHGHPGGYLPAGVLAVLVRHLLHGEPLRQALRAARAHLVRRDRHEETSQALDAAEALAGEGPPTPERVARLGTGAVGESALAIAVYAALATDDPNTALLAAVNHDGDSDSTAAVCGNIVGALYGEDALDPAWVARLDLREVVERMAEDALAEFGPNPPGGPEWTVRYPAG